MFKLKNLTQNTMYFILLNILEKKRLNMLHNAESIFKVINFISYVSLNLPFVLFRTSLGSTVGSKSHFDR